MEKPSEKVDPIMEVTKVVSETQGSALKWWQDSEASKKRGKFIVQNLSLWWGWEVVKKDHKLSGLLNH